MIHTAKQLKDKVKNMSGGNSEVAQALIRTYFMETLDKIKDDSGLEEMWNRFKRVNYFVDDLSWGEVSETIVDNIEKIFFLATRFLESVMKRE